MKISILAPAPNLSGGVRVIALYARELTKRGHEVDVICMKPPRRRLRDRIRRLIGLPARQYEHRGTAESHFADYGVHWRWSLKPQEITNDDVEDGDIVLSTFWKTAVWGMKLSRPKGVPVYFIQHDEGLVFDLKAEIEETYRQDMMQICVSPWVADSIRSRHRDARQLVIMNSVELSRFPRNPSVETRRHRIGFVHSPISSKRSDLAIQSLIMAKAKIPSLEAVVFCEALPQTLPAWMAVHRQPKAEKIAELYGSCRAWLFTSEMEGFGLPILEAMATGTPVIGTCAGVAPEYLKDGAGILCREADAAHIAEAIVGICQMDSRCWMEMSDKAFLKVSSYSWDDAVDQLESELESLLTSRQH